eukprot:UN22468
MAHRRLKMAFNQKTIEEIQPLPLFGSSSDCTNKKKRTQHKQNRNRGFPPPGFIENLNNQNDLQKFKNKNPAIKKQKLKENRKKRVTKNV